MSSGLKSLQVALFGRGDFAKILEELDTLYKTDSIHEKGKLKRRLAEVKIDLDSLQGREKEKNQKKLKILNEIYDILVAIDQENYSLIPRFTGRQDEILGSVQRGDGEVVLAAAELLPKVISKLAANKRFQETATKIATKVQTQAAQQAVALMPQPNNTVEMLKAKSYMTLSPEQRAKQAEFYSRILRVYGIDITQPASAEESETIRSFLNKRAEIMTRLGLLESLMDDVTEAQVRNTLNREEARKYMTSTSTSTRGGRRNRKSTQKKRSRRAKTRKGGRSH